MAARTDQGFELRSNRRAIPFRNGGQADTSATCDIAHADIRIVKRVM
jgi:hypothetical protein